MKHQQQLSNNQRLVCWNFEFWAVHTCAKLGDLEKRKKKSNKLFSLSNFKHRLRYSRERAVQSLLIPPSPPPTIPQGHKYRSGSRKFATLLRCIVRKSNLSYLHVALQAMTTLLGMGDRTGVISIRNIGWFFDIDTFAGRNGSSDSVRKGRLIWSQTYLI